MQTTESTTVATKKPRINTYVNDEVDAAVEKEMFKERRSKSQMVEILLEEALRARGYVLKEQTEQSSEE